MSRDLKDLAPEIRPLCADFLHQCTAAGYDVLVTQTRRTMEEQAALYALGRTKDGKIVTNAKPGESSHNYGLGFDIAFQLADGSVTWEGPWAKVGAIGESVGLAWGGRWRSFSDKPHFEMPDWRSLVPKPETTTPLLKRGSKGPAVKRLQEALNELIWWREPLVPDGNFGAVTEAYLLEFIDLAGLSGNATTPEVWAAIAAALARGKA